MNIAPVVYSNGWPTDASALSDASAIVIYSDGGGGHPFLQSDRLKTIGALMDKGVGLVAIHYAVEPTKEKGQNEWLDWIGGAFEIHWSVNPHWDADFKTLPKHPITKGVNPFKIRDEWYYNMRFREGKTGVTAILSAIPDSSTTNRSDGPHSGNPTVRGIVARGEPVTVAWAATRPNGGRGFGFTGAHFHQNWANDEFRKLVLNAIVWAAKAKVPPGGVESHVTEEQMNANLDPKGKK
jgi:type 1 glutamine amidotransferase